MKRICEVCGKEFTVSAKKSKERISCSFECRKQLSKQKRIYRQTERIKCQRCGEYFISADMSSKKQKDGTVHFTYCKKCWSEITIQHKKNRKQKLIESHGSKCCVCGYNKCEKALEFHHIDSSEKINDVSKIYKNSDMEKEIEKCILLCANCHRELHDGLISI